MAGQGPESQYDFTITGTNPVAFVRVKFTEHLRAVLAEILWQFDGEVRRLRSRYGTWRFFYVMTEAIIELNHHGQPLAEIDGTSVAEA